jgi:hypothetical protein
MLRIEYEKRNVPIANLSISEANTRLKDLIKKYIKKAYPFDRNSKLTRQHMNGGVIWIKTDLVTLSHLRYVKLAVSIAPCQS